LWRCRRPRVAWASPPLQVWLADQLAGCAPLPALPASSQLRQAATLDLAALRRTVNLAVALATGLGLRVGLLDADVHGPSIGKMMNLRGKPTIQSPGAPARCIMLRARWLTLCVLAIWRGQGGTPCRRCARAVLQTTLPRAAAPPQPLSRSCCPRTIIVWPP
jgi:hypothetical protein